MTTNNFNNINNNNEKNDKKTFEGITKMNKTFSKFNNKEENKENSYNRNNNKQSTEKDRNSRSFYENRSKNLRSLSPITHKKNEHVESYKLLETKFEVKGSNQEANLSYFDEFNVKSFKKILNIFNLII